MSVVVDVIVAMFNWLVSTKLFNIGLIWWVATPTFFGLAMSLFAKKGDNDEN